MTFCTRDKRLMACIRAIDLAAMLDGLGWRRVARRPDKDAPDAEDTADVYQSKSVEIEVYGDGAAEWPKVKALSWAVESIANMHDRSPSFVIRELVNMGLWRE